MKWLSLIIVLLSLAPFCQAEKWKNLKGRTVTAEYAGFNEKLELQLSKGEDQLIAIPLVDLNEPSLKQARKIGVEQLVSQTQKNLPWVALACLGATVLTAIALFLMSRMLRSTFTFWTAMQCAGYLLVVELIVEAGLCVGVSMSSKMVVGVILAIAVITPVVVVSKMYQVSFGNGIVYYIGASLMLGIISFPAHKFLESQPVYTDLLYSFGGLVYSLYV